MVDKHLDRCDEDATFQKLREQLEALDLNGDVEDVIGEFALSNITIDRLPRAADCHSQTWVGWLHWGSVAYYNLTTLPHF